MKHPRIYLSAPHMNGREMGFIQEAFDTNWIAPLGPNVDGFEKEVCRYVGVKHGAALSSGTAAIHLCLKYLGVEQGDYVFCSSLTFSGSCNAIAYEKAVPVFIDAEPDSWNMSPEALEGALEWAKREGKLPRAVIVVNLYGQSADYDRLLPLCEAYGVPVIEDAAESLGATYRGDGNNPRQTGSFGRFGVFSFNGNKIITTSGGGMVVTEEEEAVKKMKFWATQAREPARHYEHREIGYNYRMSNICAGIGRGQLLELDRFIRRRKAIYKTYEKAFAQADLPVTMMPISPKGEPNYWLSVMTLDEGCPVTPEHLMTALEAENIEARPVWKPMHLQPVFSHCPFFPHPQKTSHGDVSRGPFFERVPSVSEDLFRRGVCLPSGTGMTDEEQQRVVDVILGVFNG